MNRPELTTSAPDKKLHEAAVIDSHGNEIPITEAMIQKACKAIDEDCSNFIPSKKNPQR